MRAARRLIALAFSVLTAACTSLVGLEDLPVPEDATSEGTIGEAATQDVTGQDATDGGGDVTTDTGSDTAPGEGGQDSTAVDVGSDAPDADGGGDSDPCAPSGTGAVAKLGCPCVSTGELACNGNAQKVTLICGGGVWTFNKTCSAADDCDSAFGANQGVCLPIDPLCSGAAPGQNVCLSASQVTQCGPDLVSDTAGAACNNQTCVSGVCTGTCGPGATQCMGQQPQSCQQGSWQSTGATCPYACIAGACTGVCTPNSVQCSGTQPQTCDMTGQWTSPNPPCSGATPVCTQGSCATSCANGTTQCSGNGLETCSGGTWGSPVACPFVCTGTACAGVCAPGATQCSGNGVQTCDATGNWGVATACTGSLPFCVAGACEPCSPTTTQCSGNGVETCDPTGNWGAPAACTNQTCTGGTCTGTCAPNQTQCSPTSNAVETCNASGQWGSDVACTNQTCVGGTCSGVCAPTQTECSGNGIATCTSGGAWGTPVACTGAMPVCLNTTCVACSPGSLGCVGTQPQTCSSSGQWVPTGSACSGAAPVCSNGVCSSYRVTGGIRSTAPPGGSTTIVLVAGGFELGPPACNVAQGICVSGGIVP